TSGAPGSTAATARARFSATAAGSSPAPKPTLSPATTPPETPPCRPTKPCGRPSSVAARMTSTGSAKALGHLLADVARQAGRSGDALQLGAHHRRADRLDPPPTPERRHEARGRLRVDRVEREDKIGDQAITL